MTDKNDNNINVPSRELSGNEKKPFFIRRVVHNPVVYNDPVINGINVLSPMAQAISIRTKDDIQKLDFLNNYIQQHAMNRNY